ncbi:MAG: ATP-dependent DNA helicase RecG, partial [Burkholderiales bacterium]|nr:ATP-dependent DNA helicase RecG [Burkholderiales bacterium]
EILAEQHLRKFTEWLSPLGVTIAWLSGSQAKAERAAALRDIAAGAAQVAIGTHALFQQRVAFRALGLAIVDEQHRFGVAQRLALRGGSSSRGRGARQPSGPEPHLLMMSATPIPRTLSMSCYADLDISTIDEQPPGRRRVLTKLVSAARRGEVLARLRQVCAEGRQAYWVCPLIEESEALQLQTALDTYATLSAELPELKVGLAHGRLSSADKNRVMDSFAGGRTQLLVATTVIEVGVDVPNATLMVVEHAERFGLAQLHQLRGRVGRGADASVCVLLYGGPLGPAARRRLKVIYENDDGFAIAREDLELRGPGEYLGARQSGAPLLRFADLLQDEAMVGEAREAAELLLERYPEAAEKHLDRWLGARAEFLMA